MNAAVSEFTPAGMSASDPQVTEWVTRPPGGALAGFIERYVGYRLSGHPAGTHRGLPSRFMTFIVAIGDEIDVIAQTDPRHAPRRYRCVVSGLQVAPALIADPGRQEGIAIELTPLGARAVFAMPASELWNTSLELDDVVGPVGVELWERLQSTCGWDARFAVCDAVLGRLVGDGVVEATLTRAWRGVVASGGTVTVADLSRRIGWTRQHLTRRFADEFGLSPKRAARVVRFDRARRMLQAGPSVASIAQVAKACGYFDQAHLTRDFVALAGCPPGSLLAEEVPSFQDTRAPEPSPSAV